MAALMRNLRAPRHASPTSVTGAAGYGGDGVPRMTIVETCGQHPGAASIVQTSGLRSSIWGLWEVYRTAFCLTRKHDGGDDPRPAPMSI